MESIGRGGSGGGGVQSRVRGAGYGHGRPGGGRWADGRAFGGWVGPTQEGHVGPNMGNGQKVAKTFTQKT